jgi:hypothetical protein
LAALRAGFFLALTFGAEAEAAFVIFFAAFFFAGAFRVVLADFMLAAFAAGFFACIFDLGFAFDLMVRFMVVSCLVCGGRCRLEGSSALPPARLMRRNLPRETEDKVSKCTPRTRECKIVFASRRIFSPDVFQSRASASCRRASVLKWARNEDSTRAP